MIHQYINNGYHIVLDVNSGSVHSVDALLYDAVEVLAKIVPDMEKPMPLTDDQKKTVREKHWSVSTLQKILRMRSPIFRSSSTRRSCSLRIFTKIM